MTNEKKSTPCSARGQFVPLWAVFSGKNGKTDRQGCVERKNEEISAVPWRSAARAAPFRRRPRPSCPSCRRAVLPLCRRARRKGHPGADVSETTGQGRAERKIRRKPQPEAKASGCGLQTEKTPFQEKRGGFRRKIAQKGAQRIPAENPGKVTLSFYCRSCGCGFPNRNPRN